MKKYIGIPYKENGRDFNGVDCYGVIYLFFKEEFGVIVPEVTDLIYSKDRFSVKEKEDHLLKAIGIKWVPVDTIKKFDVLVFNKKSDCKISSHVGLYLGRDKFLHVTEDLSSSIARLDEPYWSSKLYGAMRWHK